MLALPSPLNVMMVSLAKVNGEVFVKVLLPCTDDAPDNISAVASTGEPLKLPVIVTEPPTIDVAMSVSMTNAPGLTTSRETACRAGWEELGSMLR
jgi:hypothetical protein